MLYGPCEKGHLFVPKASDCTAKQHPKQSNLAHRTHRHVGESPQKGPSSTQPRPFLTHRCCVPPTGPPAPAASQPSVHLPNRRAAIACTACRSKPASSRPAHARTHPLPPQSETRFTVGMTCEGCSGAVKRILGKIEGVSAVETDVQAKRVVVTGTAAPEAMLAALKKWGDASGKQVELQTAAA